MCSAELSMKKFYNLGAMSDKTMVLIWIQTVWHADGIPDLFFIRQQHYQTESVSFGKNEALKIYLTSFTSFNTVKTSVS